MTDSRLLPMSITLGGGAALRRRATLSSWWRQSATRRSPARMSVGRIVTVIQTTGARYTLEATSTTTLRELHFQISSLVDETPDGMRLRLLDGDIQTAATDAILTRLLSTADLTVYLDSRAHPRPPPWAPAAQPSYVAADEALARRLQAEEDAEAEAEVASRQHPEFLSRLRSGVVTTALHEDPARQAFCRQTIPLEEIVAQANAAADAEGGGAAQRQHELARHLLRFFKGWFAWVDTLPCPVACSPNKKCEHAGGVAPTAAERAWGASVVELHRCGGCGAVARFPRINDPARLLETRRGRCGEWANCFTLVLRSAGLDARWVLDFTDHVWCEFFSEKENRWIHLDPCEAAFDTPLLYEQGWKKQLTYVLGFSRSGAVDVTRRYTADYTAVALRRRDVPEPWLSAALAAQTRQLLATTTDSARVATIAARAAAESMALVMHGDRGRPAVGSSAGPPLPGRVTGDEAWRRARGELGDAAESEPPPVGCRLAIAAVCSSGENAAAGESAARAADGDPQTKWLDFGGGGGGTAWLCYDLEPHMVVAAYALVTANDEPGRDPWEWAVEGDAGDGVWVTLDARAGETFHARWQRRCFTVDEARRGPWRAVRLRVLRTRDPGANSTQLACFDLHGPPPACNS